jgi:hypothetical protein
VNCALASPERRRRLSDGQEGQRVYEPAAEIERAKMGYAVTTR